MKYIGSPIEYFILAMLLMVLFSVWNGLVNKQMFQDKTEDEKEATSALWHYVGGIVRGILGLIGFLSLSWDGFLISVILGFFVYNKLMNVVRGLPFDHYGTKGWDKVVKKYKLDYFVAIISLILLVVKQIFW